jgi:MFS superfamily sulfate permease-like transporter
MPPQAGLFTFAAGAVGFAVFGTNRFLVAGADSTIAPIIASGLAALAGIGSPAYGAEVTLLSLMIGAVLIGAAVLRAGWIADLMSIPVTAGFMAGIAVQIIFSQLPSVLGLPDVDGPLAAQVARIVPELPQANAYAVTIGLFVLIVTQTTGYLSKHIPGAFLAMVMVMIAAALLHLDQRGVDMLGALPAARPTISLPSTSLSDFLRLSPLALIVALVCMMQTAVVLRAFPSHPDGPRHVAHDFGGIGAGCILAGLIGGFPVNASPPSTAVVVSAGGRSQAMPLMAATLAAALLFEGGWLLAFLPHAALAGILIAVALRIFHLREIISIAQCGGSEIWLVAASILLVVGLPSETGMLASIVLSLLHSIYTVARPLCVELARVPGTTVWWPPHGEAGEHEPGVLVFAHAAPLNFTNATFIRGQLMNAVGSADTPVRLVVIEASGVTDIDYTGANVMNQTVETLRARGLQVALARLSSERAQGQAVRTGLLEAFGDAHVFRSVEDAVRAFKRERPA